MVGIGALVTGVAPLAGGVLLGGMAGKSGPSVPDFRAIILSDLELLQRIPEDEVTRRAALKRMIGEHVEALLLAQEKSREFKRKTRYFTEHWRDIVVFVTTLLFAVIIWHGVGHTRDHHRGRRDPARRPVGIRGRRRHAAGVGRCALPLSVFW